MSGMKIVNLEEGRPLAADAVKRLTYELHAAKRLTITALKLIHGYGSSGTGGRIRTEVRRYLERQQRAGTVRCFIPGERFSIFDADTRAALEACGELRRDRDLERHNNGITILLL